MATAFAQNAAAQNGSQTSGTITGSIKDATGAPVPGASVTVTGPQTQTTTTDAQGNFSIPNLKPGIYSFVSVRSGYNTATESNISIVSGSTQTLSVVMSAMSFTNLRTIATVRSAGRGTFNTTPASVSVATSQQIQEQGATQIMQILNQIPGIVASLPSGSANAATPGAITVPNIRGGLSFETASLIDGHPLSVGQYGDYVTTFLNPFMLNTVEVVKGPGVAAPEVNYAIGGTVNFTTKEPTASPQGLYQIGTDNFGGNIANFGFSDTVDRLGFVLAYSNDNLATKVQGQQVMIPFSGGPQTGVINYNPATGTGQVLGYNDGKLPGQTAPGIGPVASGSNVYNSYGLVGCCFPLQSLYNNQSELAKLTYKLSSATRASFTYLGSQTWANQAANTSDFTPSFFQPAKTTGYTGSVPAGSAFDAAYVRTGNDTEINNEPIFEGDIRTTLGNDTILARYYAAGIDRLIYQGQTNPNQPDVYFMNLFGYDSNTKQTFNGQTVPIYAFDYYRQEEIDSLKGYSLQYSHPFGSEGQNQAALSYDTTDSTTISCSSGISGGPNAQKATFNSNTIAFSPSCSLPKGSSQIFGTLLARVNFQINPKLNFQIANYANSYKSTYPAFSTPNGGNCRTTRDGSQCIFNTTTRTHDDPRFALTYRPSRSVAIRASAGSSIAPPYLGILNSITGQIKYAANAPFATQSVNAGTLQPETAFGWDLGADYRLADAATSISGDVYLTNLFNHFISQTYPSGSNCPAIDPTSGAATNCPPNTPLYFTSQTNLNNARFEGIELSVRRRPFAGFGYTVQGSLEKAYAYNLPPNFYCSFVPNPTATPPKLCTPANYDTNLAIIPGANFTGNPIGYNAFSNTSIPYATGYGELNYHWRNGSYVLLGATYFGNNNSLFRPAFVTANMGAGYTFNNGLQLQVTGSNINNQYSGLFPNYGGNSVFLPLANGQVAATQGNVLGPAIYRFTLTKYIGAGVTPGF